MEAAGRHKLYDRMHPAPFGYSKKNNRKVRDQFNPSEKKFVEDRLMEISNFHKSGFH